jgi:hypothetical protein
MNCYVVSSIEFMVCLLNAVNYVFSKVGRIKQKRGYKDQWPWNIKIYTDDSGKAKGDACLAYEDPSAAHSAGGFYNSKITVEFTLFNDINLSTALVQSSF